MMPSLSRRDFLLAGTALTTATLGGCFGGSEVAAVVYAALDREFSDPILQQFAAASGKSVLPKYDLESTKTVGLVTEIMQQAKNPRCDLFWNNEILHSIRLEKAGLLEPYTPKRAAEFPAQYQAANHTWHGFAARARVLIINKKLIPDKNDYPTSLDQIADDIRWQGKCGFARPIFGTTATQAAVLFATAGESFAKEFFLNAKKNAAMLSGNKQVAEAVGRGDLAWGLTDTDDAWVEHLRGRDIDIVFPDQDENEEGTLLVPNTLCLIKNSPHQAIAKELIDYLLTPEIEDQLAIGESAQFPLHPAAKNKSLVLKKFLPADAPPLKWQQVDFAAAADAWQTAGEFLQRELIDKQ